MPETTSASAFPAPETTTTPELPKLDGNEVILPLDTADNTQPTSLESFNPSKVKLSLINSSRGISRFNQDQTLHAPLTGLASPANEDIVFSTYLGGGLSDNLRDVVIDGNGGIYVTGSSSSPDYPVTPGVFSVTGSL